MQSGLLIELLYKKWPQTTCSQCSNKEKKHKHYINRGIVFLYLVSVRYKNPPPPSPAPPMMPLKKNYALQLCISKMRILSPRMRVKNRTLSLLATAFNSDILTCTKTKQSSRKQKLPHEARQRAVGPNKRPSKEYVKSHRVNRGARQNACEQRTPASFGRFQVG